MNYNLNKPPEKYKFKKGKSGNPAGRPIMSEKSLYKLTYRLFQALMDARQEDKQAMKKLKEIKEILEHDKK